MNFICDSCGSDLHDERIHSFVRASLFDDEIVEVTLCDDCRQLMSDEHIKSLVNWVRCRDILGIRFMR